MAWRLAQTLTFATVLAAFVAGAARDGMAQVVDAPPQLADLACPPVSEDPQYAFSRERPVQIGGGPMYGPARGRRYLEALRGPKGEPIRYKRTGASIAADGDTVIDGYDVTYDGLEKPLHLVLDSYHYSAPRLPRGFTCGQPMNLGLPPADPFTAMPELLALAIEQGAQRDMAPIPLDPAQPERGAAYDHFRLLARMARAAGHDRVLDPKSPPREMARPRTVLIARPLTCDDRTVAVEDIALVTPQGELVPRDASDAQKDTVAALLPGVDVPQLGRAAVYGLDWPRPGLSVRITYREPACPGDLKDVSLPVQFTAPRLVESSSAALPQGNAASEELVTLQVLIDHEGALRRAMPIGGPAALSSAAIGAVGTWRAEPARVNGVPVAVPIVVQVAFKATTPR